MKAISLQNIGMGIAALCVMFLNFNAPANPQGGTVSQGTATFNSQGPVLTIQTSDRAHINWSSFNINPGEITSFIQPSSSSVVWNQINDSNPSQILGNLSANGYVVLQNQSGFFIGGQASISAHGLILTTAPLRTPDLSGGGPWHFDAPPPNAKIINYGQISSDSGGSVFLISHDIENHGTISADQGTLGLYANKDVLLSTRPDGRGLSANVKLPEGSVDNDGKLIADAGTIALHAQVVNQGGLIQANSVRQMNGVIELVASDSINLAPASTLSARGDVTSADPSQGGFVVVKSDQAFSDSSGSRINVPGNSGGRNGAVEIFGNGVTASSIQSQINAHSASDFLTAGGLLVINPQNVTLSSSASTPDSSNPNLNVSDLSGFSKIDLFAQNNITLSTSLGLSATADPLGMLALSAGGNITLQKASGSAVSILGGNNWNINLSAGPEAAASKPASGGGIYLKDDSYIQAQNGSISLWAANEVIVNPGADYPNGSATVGNNGIRTLAGGSISVTAEFGDVNTGGNYQGFLFGQKAAPYYGVSPNLGGISTKSGGDVTISAGGDVTSFLPVQSDYNHAQGDGGTGAFGPGNVTITANGNIYGHYVLANGVGTMTAGAGDSTSGDFGVPFGAGQSKGFALSLIKGSWNISAPHGSIYLQDVRNPNGVFDDRGGTPDAFAGYHRFDYDPQASVTVQAAERVEITGVGAPHSPLSAPGSTLPTLFPPSLQVSAGSGGFVLDTDVLLFSSPFSDLHITTTPGSHGNFQSYQEDPDNLVVHQLAMSDSPARQWDPGVASSTFGGFLNTAVSANPPELSNPNAVEISIDGSINNVNLRTTKATHISVGGDMFNSGLLGENLHSGDTTSINVAGRISYPPLYSFVQLSQPIMGADPFRKDFWDSIFYLLVDPERALTTDVPGNASPQQLTDYAITLRRFPGSTLSAYDPAANPGFVYDPATKQLGFRFVMNQTVRSALEGPLEVIQLDGNGRPQIQRGQASLGQDPTKYYFVTRPVSFVSAEKIEELYQESLSSTRGQISPGFQIGGPGTFTVKALGMDLDGTHPSMDLGSSHGIISWGIGNGTQSGALDYSGLASLTSAGAALNVNVAGSLNMLSSTIASIYGGDVNVAAGNELKMSQGNFALIPPDAGAVCYGIFTSGHSDVNVTAGDDINVGGARIATFNGGNVSVASEHGDVNAGNGANSTLTVPVVYLDPKTHELTSGTIGDGTRSDPRPYGSGILAISPTAKWQTPGGNVLPGDIAVSTPEGNIVSTLGGIQQFALNGSIAGGPMITLTAGTPASAGSPGHHGDVDLGLGGVVGGTIDITAQGDIKGLIVSRQNSTINAAQSFNGTLLAGGNANVSAGAGGISGTVIGIGGVNASSAGGVTASLLGQNVSVGGGEAQSTLGTTAAATATSQAAAQQANTESQQQVLKSGTDEDDEKKKGARPTLTRKVGRVTVILPAKS